MAFASVSHLAFLSPLGRVSEGPETERRCRVPCIFKEGIIRLGRRPILAVIRISQQKDSYNAGLRWSVWIGR
ncbi:Os10g0480050 [Oryza sativa Japonica Group]|uniref:Os10g0480050 protein n=1 Tax=Oryza sativa subsp. japonica TaxID=39947 RepID=A0A0P0XVC7_ORYSJ|nr:Os10g0480050 [Oryza sativa Japonica Group]